MRSFDDRAVAEHGPKSGSPGPNGIVGEQPAQRVPPTARHGKVAGQLAANEQARRQQLGQDAKFRLLLEHRHRDERPTAVPPFGRHDPAAALDAHARDRDPEQGIEQQPLLQRADGLSRRTDTA